MRHVRGATAAHAPASAAALAQPQQRSPLAPRSTGSGAEGARAGGRLDSAQDLERAAMAEAAVRALFASIEGMLKTAGRSDCVGAQVAECLAGRRL